MERWKALALCGVGAALAPSCDNDIMAPSCDNDIMAPSCDNDIMAPSCDNERGESQA